MRHVGRSAVRLIVVACVATACGEAPGRAPAAPADSVDLALRPYFRELKTVELNGSGRRLTMLVDTGGGATLIAPDVARQIGCTPFGRDVGHRMSGEAVEFQRCESIELSAGSWRHRLEPVAVFDIGRLLPPELPKLDGVLALDAFRGSAITLDWAAGELRVLGPKAADAALGRAGVPVRIATGDSGRFYSALVPVAAARGPLWFLLDSGNIRGTLVARHAVRDGRLDLRAGGDVSLAVGGRPPVTLRAEAADLDIDGALGTAWLLLGPVTLDLRFGPAR